VSLRLGKKGLLANFFPKTAAGGRVCSELGATTPWATRFQAPDSEHLPSDAPYRSPLACFGASPLLGEPGSLAVPETVTGEVVRLAPFVGLEITTVGGVMSMLTVKVTGLDVREFPAAS